jgi:uncharacterized protein
MRRVQPGSDRIWSELWRHTRMRDELQQKLCEIEKDHDIRIVWAVESGSRLWGLASSESDYDVKCVYVHRPEWYLSINEGADAIDLPIHNRLDVSGWDVRKTLRLLVKSNISLMTWTISTLVYREVGGLADDIRELVGQHYSPKAVAHQYLNMATLNIRKHIDHASKVPVKIYLYTLQPLLNVQWMMQGKGLPPSLFLDLMSGIEASDEVLEAVSELVTLKTTKPPKSKTSRLSVIDEWISELVDEARTWVDAAPSSKVPVDQVNAVFRRTLKDVWA